MEYIKYLPLFLFTLVMIVITLRSNQKKDDKDKDDKDKDDKA